jgi:hypothetical protein
LESRSVSIPRCGRAETDPVYEMLCSLEYWTINRVQNPSNQTGCAIRLVTCMIGVFGWFIWSLLSCTCSCALLATSKPHLEIQ